MVSGSAARMQPREVGGSGGKKKNRKKGRRKKKPLTVVCGVTEQRQVTEDRDKAEWEKSATSPGFVGLIHDEQTFPPSLPLFLPSFLPSPRFLGVYPSLSGAELHHALRSKCVYISQFHSVFHESALFSSCNKRHFFMTSRGLFNIQKKKSLQWVFQALSFLQAPITQMLTFVGNSDPLFQKKKFKKIHIYIYIFILFLFSWNQQLKSPEKFG